MVRAAYKTPTRHILRNEITNVNSRIGSYLVSLDHFERLQLQNPKQQEILFLFV
jgi:hypothetical protein